MANLIEKKTKQLVRGDRVMNVLNHRFYEMVSVESSGAGYIVKLDGREDGCTYYADYTTRHKVESLSGGTHR